jgi:phage gpG-like protein
MHLQFRIEGKTELSRKFRGISTDVKNWKPQMKKVGDYLIKVFSGPVFTSRGAEIGEPWKARKDNNPWPLLQRTGKMRKSFKYQAQTAQVTILNTTDYFKYHQSKQPRRKLPRRVMMKLDRERKEGIIKIFHQRLVNQIIKKRYV